MDEQNEAMIAAVRRGDRDEVERLLAAEPELVNARGGGASALLWSIYTGRAELTADLLTRPELALDLFEAAAAGQLEAVRRLLEADPGLANAFAPDGFQPLGLASFFGHTEVAALLLAHGADPHTPSRNGQRVAPLHSAAAGGHLAIARLLLEHGADPNSRQAGGFTPLHSAAQNGQRALAALLLAHGAERAARSEAGERPLDLAAAAGHDDLRDLLG